jgi:hypothetical protein
VLKISVIVQSLKPVVQVADELPGRGPGGCHDICSEPENVRNDYSELLLAPTHDEEISDLYAECLQSDPGKSESVGVESAGPPFTVVDNLAQVWKAFAHFRKGQPQATTNSLDILQGLHVDRTIVAKGSRHMSAPHRYVVNIFSP